MSDKIEIITVEMPGGDTLETDLATVEWVKEFTAQYAGGTVIAPWNEILKITAAREYLRQGSAL